MGDRTCTLPDCERPYEARGYCQRHYKRLRATGTTNDRMIPTVADRFWAKVDASGDCWVWTASLNRYGYGQFNLRAGRPMGAHRWAYEFLCGSIPVGLELDHLCRNPRCVNPDHLEPVTHRINVQRGMAGKTRALPTHCPQGHPYAGDNLYVSKQGHRQCCECRRENLRRSRARRRELARAN